MKNFIKIIGIVAMAAIIGFAFAACEGPMGPQGEKGDNGTGGTYYTVTFDANGGTGTAPGKQKVEAGYAIIFPTAEGLEKDGGKFYGWNTNANYSEMTYNTGISYTPAADIILYANYVYDNIPASTNLWGTLWVRNSNLKIYLKISDDGTEILVGMDKNSLDSSYPIKTYTKTGGIHTFIEDDNATLTVNLDLTELFYYGFTYTPVSE